MNMELPRKKGSETSNYIDVRKLVIVGANGSGKTRFGTWLELKNPEKALRISAHKSLLMPQQVMPKSKEIAEKEFFYGTSYNDLEWLKTYGKLQNRWNNNPYTALLNDYEKLLILLYTEEFDALIESKQIQNEGGASQPPVTKLDRIKLIWEELLPHRKLKIKSGEIEVSTSSDRPDKYNASNMSDGERYILYMIGECICAPENSIIIIDEPEMYLHKSLVKKLWDKVESIREDCTFIYLTHDIDFALSRNSDKILWLKAYEDKDTWDYEEVTSIDGVPDDIYLEILGSRKPILFIEGEKSSYDQQIYQQLFPQYTITPLGACEKVIECTKSFNSMNAFHRIEAKGIIDRDRKSEDELIKLRDSKIYAPDIAEVENFFLLEEVIRLVANILKVNADESFSAMSEKMFDLFNNNLNQQTLQHAKYHVVNNVMRILNSKSSSISDFKINFQKLNTEIEIEGIHESFRESFEQIIETHDYKLLLKVLNHKGALANSAITACFGLTVNGYRDLVLRTLKRDDEFGQQMRTSMKNYINIDN